MNIDKIKKLYLEDGLSQRKIAEQLNEPYYRIRYFIRKNKLIKNKHYPELDINLKKCPQCKKTKPRTEFYKANKEGRRISGSWCKICMTKQVINRQRAYKKFYIKQKGGCCQVCSFDKYDGALEFHHIDPSKKDASMSSMTRKPDSPEVQAELKKCILLCSNCHKMIHAGLIECKPSKVLKVIK